MKGLLKLPYRLLHKPLRLSLSFLEYRKLMSIKTELDYPPIFIVGPPRSGSTLLYQLMVHHFYLSYFTTIANRYNRLPVMATKLGLKYCEAYVSDFKSNFGVIQGRMAPHEAGMIWNRWYPTEDIDGYNYTPAGYFDEKTKHIIYQTVAGVERVFNAPFINKNVKQSVRIKSLVEIFPKALFVQIKRNPFDNGCSILKLRKAKTKNINEWLAVMPKEIDQLRDKNYLEQICGQIFFLEKNIEEDISEVGRERLKVVHYDDLCDYPKRELDEISSFIKSHGCNLRIKNDVPNAFEKVEYKKKDFGEEEKRIFEIMNRLYGET